MPTANEVGVVLCLYACSNSEDHTVRVFPEWWLPECARL